MKKFIATVVFFASFTAAAGEPVTLSKSTSKELATGMINGLNLNCDFNCEFVFYKLVCKKVNAILRIYTCDTDGAPADLTDIGDTFTTGVDYYNTIAELTGQVCEGNFLCSTGTITGSCRYEKGGVFSSKYSCKVEITPAPDVLVLPNPNPNPKH